MHVDPKSSGRRSTAATGVIMRGSIPVPRVGWASPNMAGCRATLYSTRGIHPSKPKGWSISTATGIVASKSVYGSVLLEKAPVYGVSQSLGQPACVLYNILCNTKMVSFGSPMTH